MLYENEIKKLDLYFEGKYLIDDDKDLELKKILSYVIEERNKVKEMVKNNPNDMDLGKLVRSYFRNINEKETI